jgi:hypothetical protein
MGKFIYDSNLTTDFDDRVLAHLQIVIGAKLRRNESFFFTWRDDPMAGDGRNTVWLHPALPVRFKYVGGRMPSINRIWIDQLANAANSGTGLVILPEPIDLIRQRAAASDAAVTRLANRFDN